MGNYAAAKAGVEAFADSLRVELHHHGVDVGVGYFSWIDTEMVAGTDRHPALGFRAKLPGPFGKTYPVSKVGDAVRDGDRAAQALGDGAGLGAPDPATAGFWARLRGRLAARRPRWRSASAGHRESRPRGRVGARWGPAARPSARGR